MKTNSGNADTIYLGLPVSFSSNESEVVLGRQAHCFIIIIAGLLYQAQVGSGFISKMGTVSVTTPFRL